MTILAVDDESFALSSLIARLKEVCPNAMILGADSSEEALKIAKECQIELLVTDLSLPVMEGEELAQRIHERYPTAGILFETGESSYSIKNRGVPMERVLLKPITSNEIEEKLKELPNLPPFQIKAAQRVQEETKEVQQEKKQKDLVLETESWFQKISKKFKNK